MMILLGSEHAAVPSFRVYHLTMHFVGAAKIRMLRNQWTISSLGPLDQLNVALDHEAVDA